MCNGCEYGICSECQEFTPYFSSDPIQIGDDFDEDDCLLEEDGQDSVYHQIMCQQ